MTGPLRGSKPASVRSRTDFPAPLPPTITVILPAVIVRFVSASIVPDHLLLFSGHSNAAILESMFVLVMFVGCSTEGFVVTSRLPPRNQRSCRDSIRQQWLPLRQ